MDSLGFLFDFIYLLFRDIFIFYLLFLGKHWGVVAVMCVCVCVCVWWGGGVGCRFLCFLCGFLSRDSVFTHRSVELFNLLHLPAEWILVLKVIFIFMNVIYFN